MMMMIMQMMMMMMMMTHLKGKSWHWQWLEACSSKVHFSIQGIEGKRAQNKVTNTTRKF